MASTDTLRQDTALISAKMIDALCAFIVLIPIHIKSMSVYGLPPIFLKLTPAILNLDLRLLPWVRIVERICASNLREVLLLQRRA